METKLWTILLIVSAMAAVTKQMDLSSIMGFNKKDKLTTTPPPVLDAYGQPQSGFAPVKLNKFDQTKQELKILTKLEKEQDKLFKLQQKEPMINSTYNPHGLAIPVENPVQYGALPQNYTAHRDYAYHKPGFKMVVAEVAINGSFEYKRQTKSAFKDLRPEFAKDKKHNSIQGTLFISEIYPSICLVSGVVTGLPPNSKFGVAIHSFGDVTNGCQSIGPHYNPDHKQHGNINAPNSQAGDLGDLRSNVAGVAFVNKISRNQFSILGKKPVAGRSVGICERQDDLGLGGNDQSLRDGNCGQILACGLIELTNTGAPMSNSGHY